MNCRHIAVVLFLKVVYHRGRGHPFKTVIGFGKAAVLLICIGSRRADFTDVDVGLAMSVFPSSCEVRGSVSIFLALLEEPDQAWPHHTVMNVSLRTAFLKIFMWTEASPMSSCSEEIRHKVWGGSQKSCRYLGAGRWHIWTPALSRMIQALEL